jgi:2'-5' RNA ligase
MFKKVNAMTNRSICIFPQFQNQKEIQILREKYDPLYSFIPPHITLVHPFQSNLRLEELINHLNHCLQHTNPFEIRLSGVSGAAGYYLFLNVKIGNDSIIQLRDQLYSGILEKFLLRDISYMPHLTLGKLTADEEFHKALNDTLHFTTDFTAVVNKIAIERIAEDGTSTLEYEYKI